MFHERSGLGTVKLSGNVLYKAFWQATQLTKKNKMDDAFPAGAHVPPRIGEIAYTDVNRHGQRYWCNNGTKLVHFSVPIALNNPPQEYFCHGFIYECGNIVREIR